jgi:hypothetical protein
MNVKPRTLQILVDISDLDLIVAERLLYNQTLCESIARLVHGECIPTIMRFSLFGEEVA